MANQVVSSYVNFDSPALSGLNDMESITFSGLGGHLVMNADNRWGQNNAVFSTVTITGEGKWTIDGTKIWEIPFSSSTGTVPPLSTIDGNPVLGLTSGATGELFRVWSTTQTTPISTSLVPLASGVAMPTNGYIKLRYKSGDFQAGEIIRLPNNSTIVADNAGKRSWINIVARTNNSIVRRQGNCKMTGDWYYLGVTNGADNQTFQFPTFDACPAIWVETSPNSDVYESWPNAGYSWDYNESTLTNGLKNSLITTDIRGKYFGMIDPLNGVIQIAKRDGLGNKAGYKPVAGCRVRIPNIILSNSYTVAPYNTNTYTRTLSSGARKQTITFQDFYLDKVSSNWNIDSKNCNSVYIKDSSISDYITLENVQQGVQVINTCISPSYWLDNNLYSFSMRYCNNTLLSGLNIFTSAWNPNSYSNKNTVALITEQENLNIQDCKFILSIPSVANGISTNGRPMTISQINNSTFNNNTLVGALGTAASNCKNILIQNLQYSHTIAASSYDTSAGNGGIFDLDSCRDITVDGLSWFGGIDSTVVTGNLTRVYNNSDNITFQNFGTYNSPLYTGNGSTIISTSRLGYLGEATNTTYQFDSASNVKYKRIYLTGLKSDNNSNVSYGGVIREFSGYPNNVTLQNVHVLSGGNVFNPRSRDLTLQGCRGSLPISTFYTNAVYGTHFTDIYTSDTTGTLTLYTGNEPSDTTSPYLSTNIPLNEGEGGFTGDGRLLLYTQGHSVIWEMPYYALGYTAFLSGGLTTYGTGGSNYIMEYQYDKGNGFNNVWLPITTGTSSPNLTAINPIDPNVGFKIKLKATKINNATNLADLRNIRIPLSATPLSQQIQYPLPKTNKGIISNLIRNSRVQIYNETTSQELYNNIHEIVGDLEYSYNNGEEITVGDVLRVRITYINGATAKLRQELKAVATVTGFAAFAEQEDDLIYNQHAIDGSLVTEFFADYPTIQVDISDLDQKTSIPRLYAWWVANEYTEQGIRNYFEGLLAEDVANYKIITDVVDLKLDNTRNVGVIFEGDYRLYRDDGDIPIVTTTSGGGSVILYAGRVNITTVETGVSGLTEEESDTLLKINTLPQDTFNLKVSAITMEDTIGMRLKNSSTVSNVGQIISDALSI